MHRFYSIICLTSFFLFSCEKEEEQTVVSLKLGTETLVEGSQSAEQEVIIKRESNSGSILTLEYEITHISTEENLDLKAVSGTIEFQKGEFEVGIPLQIIADNNLELTEVFQITLTSATSTYEFEVGIVDDDEPGAILSDQDGFYTPNTYPSMKTVWSDEFNGSSLNTESWTYDLGNGCPNLCGWGNNELQLYGDQSNVIKVENGILTITAINDGDIYRSARIKTKGKVELTYGRIDIRARLPRGKGIWPAFWMLGSNIDSNPWPGCGEIDIIELIGSEPSTVHGTVHYQDPAKTYMFSTGSTSLQSGQFYDKFHVFSAVWNPNRIDWYLDNKLFKSFSYPSESRNIFRLPYYFLLNMAVGGRWPGSPDATTVFPQQLVVDYIRVFQ